MWKIGQTSKIEVMRRIKSAVKLAFDTNVSCDG